MNELAVYNTDSLQTGLDAYLARVNSFPYLTEEEEFNLVAKLGKKQDIVAAQKLIFSHLRYVVRVARGYHGYGLALSDLIQEGTVGLMKAVKKFDPTYGVRLVTFAIHWIKSEIHEYIIKNWKLVKVATTKAKRKLFFRLRSTKNNLSESLVNKTEAIAKELGVSVKDVTQMEQWLSSSDVSFSTSTDEEDAKYVPEMYLEDHTNNPLKLLEASRGQEHGLRELTEALAKLEPRARHIIEARWLRSKKLTLKELAKHYNISLERIRQVEKAAMQQMKLALSAAF